MNHDDVLKLIEQEGNKKEFTYKGYKCKIIRHDSMLHLCGYVYLSKNSILVNNEKMLNNLEVHGGITYNEWYNDEEYIIGFDCGHWCDYIPSTRTNNPDNYRTMEYVEKELKYLVDQIYEIESEPVVVSNYIYDIVNNNFNTTSKYITEIDYKQKEHIKIIYLIPKSTNQIIIPENQHVLHINHKDYKEEIEKVFENKYFVIIQRIVRFNKKDK